MKNKYMLAAGMLSIANPSFSQETSLQDLITLSNGEPTIIEKSDSLSISGFLNEVSTIIGDQIAINRDTINSKESRLAVASIVDVETMNSVDKIGRSLTELLMHEMQVRGFRVVDYKVTNSINVRGDGDVIFSRDVEKLKAEESINYVLSGTYTKHSDGLVLNIRLIDMSDHVVVSSAQADIPLRYLRKLYDDHATVNVGEVIEKKVEVKININRVPSAQVNLVPLM
jgi:TolB-like protein